MDTFTYNGLDLRVGKTDSTGTYSYLCDGTTPNAPVLSDGHTLYTPGLSENKNGVANYYSFDRLGNLWTLGSSSHNQTYYEDGTGFGSLFALSGSGTPFGFGGGNGSQTDTDIGFVMMGHRFYDNRIGRFISQDHAEDGNNWYAYAGNDPVNKTDPSGLSIVDLPTAEAQGHNEIAGFMSDISGGGWAAQDAWDTVDESMDRGQLGYLEGEIAKAQAALDAATAEANSVSTDTPSSGQWLGGNLDGQQI